jgi:Family of unknown function (DUF6079)
MSPSPISSLFASDITRDIEEVIKVDQTDEAIIKSEIDEYIVTDAIADHYVEILERYDATPNKPHEGIGIWVSGFFGSGKSSFAKMLGLAIGNRSIGGGVASELFAGRTSEKKIPVLLRQITERIPTHAVIFDVSTDRGIRSGNKTLTEIMYRLFLESLGYPKDLDLAELEIGLEQDGDLDEFKSRFEEVTSGRGWDERKGVVAFALTEASAAMHALRPAIHAETGDWAKVHTNRADVTPRLLASRVVELMARRKPDHSVLFVVDEVGQFVARDVDKMLDLQAIVQQLGVHGRGKHWLAVTSQEKLNELVSGLDDNRIELARLMDRFKSQVHLEPSDISEVTSKRVLTKNANAEAQLGALYDEHRGRLADHTRLSADIALPELSRQAFVDLYPLLPYQIDLIIQIVSGLRTQGGISKHSGGANRTIIKLAQQLLIHPEVRLGDREIGRLARLDQIYDLVESNIASEIRSKIHQIADQVDQPMAQPVAKVICLLQFVKSVHRTAENVAAALYPGLGEPSRLESVKEALRELEAAQLVRAGDDGYRIPTPAEDDWERVRMGMSPPPSETKRLHREILTGFWSPQPTFTLLDVKPFKAGLSVAGREEEKGDLVVHVTLADEGTEFAAAAQELRTRSQSEHDAIFWAVAVNDAVDRETVELFRSREMLSKKTREARTAAEAHLITEEQARARRHQAELQRLLRTACLSGSAYFRGNDRSPDDRAPDVAKATIGILGQVLPDVFTRFGDAAAKSAEVKRGLDALLTATDLQGLPSVFRALSLLRDEGGRTVFDINAAALRELMIEIESGAAYGTKATGKSLSEHFGRAPYGWDFDVVRLFVAVLLRAGAIQMTHKADTIETTTSVAAKDALTNNNHFRAASFQPKRGVDFPEIVKAAGHFQSTFGAAVKELALSPVVAEIRERIADSQDALQKARDLLVQHRLPGAVVLDDAIARVRAIQRGAEEAAITEFNASHQTIKDGIRRAAEIENELTPGAIADIEQARRALRVRWPTLDAEPNLDQSVRDDAKLLADLLERETFFRELVEIDRCAASIGVAYDERFDAALAEKVTAYQTALAQLFDMPGWLDLTEDAKDDIASPLRAHANDTGEGEPSIAQLRADRDACLGRLKAAIEKAHQIAEGDRIVTVDVQPYFRGGVEDTDQLEAALTGLREDCERLIADGKKIVVP